MPTSILILTVLFIIAVVVFHIYAIKKQPIPTLVTKCIASAFFIAIGAINLMANTTNPLALHLFLGLCFGFVGDAVLALRNLNPKYKYHFIGAGMLAFGVGHIFYLIALMANLANFWIAIAVGAVIAAITVLMGPKLNLHYGKLKPLIFIYGTLLATMGAATALRCYYDPSSLSIILCAAGILFMISDMMLSGTYFDKNQSKSTPTYIIGVHVTYYLAQYLIALSIAEF